MASEHQRGEMDIHEQTATYHMFVLLAKWGSLGLAALLIFLVLWFCTPTGFISSFLVGVLVTVGGIFVLREHAPESH